MDKQIVIEKTAEYVKKESYGESTGHDWWHIYRVWTIAKEIALKENANIFIVELAALLHDIADWKFNDGNEDIGSLIATQWLSQFDISPIEIKHVSDIIRTVSFKGAKVKVEMQSIEGEIVQDADRIDALGAIGIARAFAYGGKKDRELYDPATPPTLHTTFEEYKQNNSSTINHFYEKLLLLKDRMNTKTGKQIAAKRDMYMREYLKQFICEFNGEDII